MGDKEEAISVFVSVTDSALGRIDSALGRIVSAPGRIVSALGRTVSAREKKMEAVKEQERSEIVGNHDAWAWVWAWVWDWVSGWAWGWKEIERWEEGTSRDGRSESGKRQIPFARLQQQ